MQRLGKFIGMALALALAAFLSNAYAQSVPSADQLDAEARAQRVFATRLYLSDLRRTESVMYALLWQGAPYCVNRRKYSLGIPPLSISDLPPDLRKGYAESLTPTQAEASRFVYVARNSPASFVGIKEGDVLLSITEQATGRQVSPGWVLDRPANTLVSNTPIIVQIRREAADLTLTVSPQLICDVQLSLSRTSAPVAKIESGKLTISTGLLRLISSDDELALLLANELIQDQLRAALSSRKSAADGPEYAADYLSAYLVVAAGFDLSRASEVWKRIAADVSSQDQESVGARHPLPAVRSFHLNAIDEEIRQKTQAGNRVTPDRKIGLVLSDTNFDAANADAPPGNSLTKGIEARPAEDPRLRSTNTIPFIDNEGIAGYQRFLDSPLRPRAFAVGPSKTASRGAWALKFGANAAADALAYCSTFARGPCYLYAVDDRVVWNAETAHDQPAAPTSATPMIPLARPAPTGFASIGDVAAVPLSRVERLKYQAFLEKPSPRAFLITQNGQGLYWVGPTAMQDALSYCAQIRNKCGLYAVDDAVVWSADPDKRISRPDQLPAQTDESRFLEN
jgi:hypothetical protein